MDNFKLGEIDHPIKKYDLNEIVRLFRSWDAVDGNWERLGEQGSINLINEQSSFFNSFQDIIINCDFSKESSKPYIIALFMVNITLDYLVQNKKTIWSIRARQAIDKSMLYIQEHKDYIAKSVIPIPLQIDIINRHRSIWYCWTKLIDIEEGNSVDTEPESETQEPNLKLTSIRHKIILLKELGIFDKLFNDHYKTIGKGNFDELIRLILGLNDDIKTKETLRSDIGKLIKGGKGSPRTKLALKTVKFELLKIEIELK